MCIRGCKEARQAGLNRQLQIGADDVTLGTHLRTSYELSNNPGETCAEGRMVLARRSSDLTEYRQRGALTAMRPLELSLLGADLMPLLFPSLDFARLRNLSRRGRNKANHRAAVFKSVKIIGSGPISFV